MGNESSFKPLRINFKQLDVKVSPSDSDFQA